MNRHNERLHGLDHLRATAIALVLLFHYIFYYGVPGWLNAFSSFGWSGVDLFFVLSGYLIADKLFREFDIQGRVDFGGFYLNRFLRIIPAYLAVVALYFAFPNLQEGRGLQPLWRFLTFTQNISIDLHRNTFSHAWSLCVEEHFYLLLPILLYLIFSREKLPKTIYLFIAVAVSGLIIRYAIWNAFVAPAYGQTRIAAALAHIYYPTYCRLDGLLVGVAIASLFKYRPRFRKRLLKHGNGLFALSILLLIATYFLFGGSLVSQKFTSLTTAVFGFPLVSLAYGLMVIAALSPNCPLSRYKFWPSKQLATLSYCIYLSHKIVYHIVHTQMKHVLELSGYVVFLFCLCGAILCGLTLHLIVERPFLVVRDKLKTQLDICDIR
ncbi:MAG: acyltransferase [Deltaproteobacteria bacterium]|jgi:peptidoglycan/LPS O-acetylase OafA/YrhL|nr:acyltransferase [Deltaproteobacteria bacterium]